MHSKQEIPHETPEDETLEIQKAVQKDSEQDASQECRSDNSTRRHRALTHISVVLAGIPLLAGCQIQSEQIMNTERTLADYYADIYLNAPCDAAGQEDWYPFTSKEDFREWLARNPNRLKGTSVPPRD